MVHGEQAHTGSTVIADRKDALHLGRPARRLSQLTRRRSFRVRLLLLLDLRSADEDVLAEADGLLHARMAEIEARASVLVEKNSSHCWPVTPYQSAVCSWPKRWPPTSACPITG